jgi:hypothetical protein
VAQKIQVLLVCDVCDDGNAGTTTSTFGLDGTNYEIDLCDRHAGELKDGLAPFVGNARRAGGSAGGRRAGGSGGSGSGRRSGSPAAADRQRTQDIRAWAKANGEKINERGRISAAIVERYEKAHS